MKTLTPFILSLFLSLFFQPSYADSSKTTAPTLQALIDSNLWKVLGNPVIYDFNQDGLNDVALVIEAKTVQKTILNLTSRPRKLQVYFQDQNSELLLVSENSGIVLEDNQGGSRDPFESLSFNRENKTLSLKLKGGGDEWGWETEYQFQLSKNHFVLITHQETLLGPNNFSFKTLIKPSAATALKNVTAVPVDLNPMDLK